MWIILSIVAGLGDALRDASSKRVASGMPSALVSWGYSLYALPFFLPVLIAVWPSEPPPAYLVVWACAIAMVHVAGGILLVKALRHAEFSLCVPMAAFTPIFVIGIEFLLTGDLPTVWGALGAATIVFGCYALLASAGGGICGPLAALRSNPGVRYMLLLSLVWSCTGTSDRLAVRQFGLVFWGSTQILAIAFLNIPVLMWQGIPLLDGARHAKKLSPLGFFNALSFGAYLAALQIAPASYVISLKRFSILFSLVLGRVAFQEKTSILRSLGAICMLLGVVLISVFG